MKINCEWKEKKVIWEKLSKSFREYIKIRYDCSWNTDTSSLKMLGIIMMIKDKL